MFTFQLREEQSLIVVNTCNNLLSARRGRQCKPLVAFSGAYSWMHYKNWIQDWQHSCGPTFSPQWSLEVLRLKKNPMDRVSVCSDKLHRDVSESDDLQDHSDWLKIT